APTAHDRDADTRSGSARNERREPTWLRHDKVKARVICKSTDWQGEPHAQPAILVAPSNPGRRRSRHRLRSAAARRARQAPMANTLAPAFYRFKLGGFEATIVSDGPLHMGAPSPDVFVGVSKEQMTKELADNFLPTDDVLLEQNALVINTGD